MSSAEVAKDTEHNFIVIKITNETIVAILTQILLYNQSSLWRESLLGLNSDDELKRSCCYDAHPPWKWISYYNQITYLHSELSIQKFLQPVKVCNVNRRRLCGRSSYRRELDTIHVVTREDDLVRRGNEDDEGEEEATR